MKKFFLTLSFLSIISAQFSDPAKFSVNIDILKSKVRGAVIVRYKTCKI